jgi:hypothetical protein
MERIERDLLAAMQVPDPYADVLSDAAHVEP